MSSILVGVFNVTAGLLVDKARAKAAEKLKDGDVTDQKFRNLIVKNIDDIKTKLDGLMRKELLASVRIFKTGILSLNQVFEKMSCLGEEAASAELGTDSEEKETATPDTYEQAASLSVVEQTRALKVNDLNESANQSFSDAKQRFGMARLKAIEAFGIEELSTSDRILALNIWLMATILERADRPADALDECMLCLENLHAMPAVRENLRVHLAGGLKKLMNKKEREAIALAVCHANHVVFRVTQITSVGKNLPCVELGSESVHISRDARMLKFLLKHDMGHLYHGFWSFGQEEEIGKRLQSPCGITTNGRGQFIVTDDKLDIFVYSSKGEFLYSLLPRLSSAGPRLLGNRCMFGTVTTGRSNNMYIVTSALHGIASFLRVYDQHGSEAHGPIYLTRGFKSSSVTVNNNNQIFVLGHSQRSESSDFRLEVIDARSNGRSFGERILKSPCDICAASDGSVLVLDLGGSPCVHNFSPEGDHKHQFALQAVEGCSHGSIAFNHTNNTIITSCWSEKNDKIGGVSVYSKEGEFVKGIPAFAGKTTIQARQIAVTVDAQIAAVSCKEKMICVVES